MVTLHLFGCLVVINGADGCIHTSQSQLAYYEMRLPFLTVIWVDCTLCVVRERRVA